MISPPQKDWLNLNETIAEVLTIAGSQIRRNQVSIRTQLSNDLPRIMGDKIQLQQVILNLLMNAIEAMSELKEGQRELCLSSESVVEILDESSKQRRQDNLLAAAEIDHVLVAVRDSGPGLGQASLGRLLYDQTSSP